MFNLFRKENLLDEDLVNKDLEIRTDIENIGFSVDGVSLVLCEECGGAFDEYKMGKVETHNKGFSAVYTKKYCIFCMPPYDKIEVEWDGRDKKYYQYVEVTEKGKVK